MDFIKDILREYWWASAIAAAAFFVLTIIFLVIIIIKHKNLKKANQKLRRLENSNNEPVQEIEKQEQAPVKSQIAEQAAAEQEVIESETEQTVANQSAAEQPAAEQAIDEQPAAEQSETEQTAIEQSTAEQQQASVKQAVSKKPVQKTSKASPTKKTEPKKVKPKIEPQNKVETSDEETIEIKSKDKDSVGYIVAFDRPKNNWIIKKKGADRATRRAATKEEAVKIAKDLSQKHNVSLSIHKKDGKFQKH